MATPSPSERNILSILTRERLVALGREFGVSVSSRAKKETQIESLTSSGQLRFAELLRILGRDELRAACKASGLDDSGRARAVLAKRLLDAHGADANEAPEHIFAPTNDRKDIPHPDDIARVRHRQYLVEDVVPPPEPGHATLVKLVCLDDDNQGRKLEVLWELELGARLERPEAHGLGHINKMDDPRHFAAYLHAIKWSATTATDARLFQCGHQALHAPAHAAPEGTRASPGEPLHRR